jgi:tellurite methyltransferase
MSKEEQLTWNDRYRRGDHATTVPDPFIYKLNDTALPQPAGRVALDLACGAGRNAVWLAEQGWDVYGCDVSLEALRLAGKLAHERGVALKLYCAELDDYMLPVNRFDLIVVFFYLQRKLFPQIRAALRPGGLLMYRTYLLGGEPASHPQRRLNTHELPEVFNDFRALHYRETVGTRYIAEFIGHKPAETRS